MAERARVELTLLGQPLTIRTEVSPEYVKTLAAYIEKRVAALRQSGVRDTMMALSLAALDIADELFRAREEGTRQAQDVGTRLGALAALLDEALPGEGGGKGGGA
jgi:cell division protein ZapA (FtsZ GTPase activity inhibitor)